METCILEKFINYKRLSCDTETHMQATKGFVQLGQDGRTIISSAYPSFGFGGRNFVGQ